MFYKKIEKIQGQSLGFQKEVTSSDSTIDDKLLFTYANLDTVNTSYGNLFKSLRLPITTDEITAFDTEHKDTALSHLSKRELIAVEIPKGQYGELIDGKTFALTIPVMLNGVASATTLYGSYFGFNGKKSNDFNTKLTDKRCETQSYIGSLGASTTPNSNITLLYSNNIQQPIGSRTSTEVLSQQTIQIPATSISELTAYVFTTVSASTGDIVFFEISVPPSQGANTNITDIVVTVGSGTQQILKNDVTVITTANITNSAIKMYSTSSSPTARNLLITISKISTTSLSWSQWTTSNKFPTNPNDFSSGQRYALYDGFYANFTRSTKFVNKYDKPVGILYNDKGIAIITDKTLVDGFRFSAGTSSGYNGYASGTTYSGDKNFAKIYFTSTSLAVCNYKSITSEFTQNIFCVASPNEFFYTNNSTYPNSYDSSVSDKPTFITSVGLYNKYGELIGIGKMSEPIKKLNSNIIPFSVKLKL